MKTKALLLSIALLALLRRDALQVEAKSKGFEKLVSRSLPHERAARAQQLESEFAKRDGVPVSSESLLQRGAMSRSNASPLVDRRVSEPTDDPSRAVERKSLASDAIIYQREHAEELFSERREDEYPVVLRAASDEEESFFDAKWLPRVDSVDRVTLEARVADGFEELTYRLERGLFDEHLSKRAETGADQKKPNTLSQEEDQGYSPADKESTQSGTPPTKSQAKPNDGSAGSGESVSPNAEPAKPTNEKARPNTGKQSGKGAQVGQATTSDNAVPEGANGQPIDLTKLVNPFIGTGNITYGNVFPGATVPFGMAKLGIDLETYAPAGYNGNLDAPVRGVSVLHDSGTGSSSGSFGQSESMAVFCETFATCPKTLDERMRKRVKGKDVARPGYFSSQLVDGVVIEVTSTRRAGLQRWTFPKDKVAQAGYKKPTIVYDWTNDLPGTFRGGQMDFNYEQGRVMMNGSWGSSFGVSGATWNGYFCYDYLNEGKQTLAKAGIWAGDRFGQSVVTEGLKHAQQVRNEIGGQPIQAGALVSWDKTPTDQNGNPQVLVRVGTSYVSAQQACRNAEEEIPRFDFEAVASASKALWNEKLNRVIVKTNNTDLAQMFYSSLYRSFVSPNNATLEGQGKYLNTQAPYFDGLYCLWDSSRTAFPYLGFHSPRDYAQVVETITDGWRKDGFIPECRANNVPGLTQGGSDGTLVSADFLVKYAKHAKDLGVNVEDMYAALHNDAYSTPAEWNSGGRQINVYTQYGYIPFAVFDAVSTGRQTRECSRTLEYAVNDFAIRNVAKLTNHGDVAKDLEKRAYFYKNCFNPDLESMGFKNFVAKRRIDGSFPKSDPTDCSPLDTNETHACSLQQNNVFGVYESSSWEYSLYAPHDFAGLIKLLANGNNEAFIKRVDKFFDAGLYLAGNEPSFQTPIVYHYANRPDLSIDRVRQVVFENFNTGNDGIPGNDDNAAMATLLMFHLSGLYPIPGTREFLVLSPFLESILFKNELLGNALITVDGFDPASLKKKIPQGSRAYVESVTIDGKVQSSRCKIMFQDIFPERGDGKTTNVVIKVTADRAAANNCGKNASDLPSSLSTGGFDKL
ncbi:MYOSIN-BINDING PROTEIN-RELATED [Ceraceosorus bombacis]|uniref:MYOSIN-BINDING PROTEIN-RELATED n=1 Tax=Ceraceosorus bombacis TaxID=401625 RepID=A0A0P1BHY4_9BASI|nr:MYOSIN-BINDING PROTEIN-RELATED [Ceraceosorus bombacis]